MATARRAYTAEYSYRYAPEAQPERVRRTRERPQAPQTAFLSGKYFDEGSEIHYSCYCSLVCVSDLNFLGE